MKSGLDNTLADLFDSLDDDFTSQEMGSNTTPSSVSMSSAQGMSFYPRVLSMDFVCVCVCRCDILKPASINLEFYVTTGYLTTLDTEFFSSKRFILVSFPDE